METDWVKLVNLSTVDTNSACKIVTLNQSEPGMIRLTGMSKAESVSDYSGAISYSLRVDVTYMDNSIQQYAFAPFSGGTHDWEPAEFLFYPQKPIKAAKIIVMLYWRTGTVWFKDVTLQEVAAVGAFGKFDDTVICNLSSTEGFLIREFSPNQDWYQIGDGMTGNNWSLAATSSQASGMTVHTAAVTNNSGAERAGVLAYRIPVSGTNFKWCEADLRTKTATDSAFAEWKNEINDNGSLGDLKPRSKFLWGCVINDTTGYAIAIDPNYPVSFRIRYDSTTKELFVVFDLGFSSAVTSATVKFVTWTFDPSFGMRQAISDFYNAYPDAFKDEIVENGGEHGNWFIKGLSDYSLPNPQDFGLKLNQNNTTGASMAYDEANGMFDTYYVHPTELFINVADLGANPTYDQVIARLDSLASGSFVDPSNISSGVTAQTIQNSGVKDIAGKYIFHTGADWSPTFARFLMNPAPGITGRNAYYDQWTNPAIQSYLTPGTMDGIMCDNAEAHYWSAAASRTRMDYNASHFPMMQTPLSHDKNGKVGICYEMMIWEYFNGVRNDIFSRPKFLLMQANGIPYSTTFLATKLDVPGGEQTWDYNGAWNPANEEKLLHFRAQAGRKLVTFLQEMTNISLWTNLMTAKYLARSCAFGIMPSFYASSIPSTPAYFDYESGGVYWRERDRALFQQYIPIIRKLSQAGWEPITLATADDSEVFLERFGVEYFTVFNPSASSKTVTVTYLPAAINISGKELISGGAVTWANGQATVTVGPECVAVLEIPAKVQFQFDEGQLSSVAAQSPYSSITGICSAQGTSWVTNGVDASALSFDGINGYVQIPDNQEFDILDNGLTYSAWIKANALNPSGHSTVISKQGGQYISIHSKYLYFKLTTDGTNQRYCYGTTQLQNNTWYHVAATYDREGYMKVFINGRQDGLTRGPFLNPVNNPYSIRIGDLVASGRFDGMIDEVHIYAKGLTEKEIRRLKDQAITAYYFPLNEGAGTTAFDYFDPSRQGAISGAAWHGNTTLDKKDNALYFNGESDYVDIPGSSAIFRTDGTNGFTLAAWIKAEAAFPAGHDMVIAKANTYLSVYNGKLLFKTMTSGTQQCYCSSATALPVNAWCHVAAVYEANGSMKLYLNGVLNQTAGPYANPTNETGTTQIGRGYGANYFKGIIENVHLYKRGLTGEEINLLFQNHE